MFSACKRVPNQWKSLLKCNFAHSGAPSKKPPWEDFTSNGITAMYTLGAVRGEANETFISDVVSPPAGARRRQMEYWSSSSAGNGKSVSTFLGWAGMHFHQNSRVTVDYEAAINWNTVFVSIHWRFWIFREGDGWGGGCRGQAHNSWSLAFNFEGDLSLLLQNF